MRAKNSCEERTQRRYEMLGEGFRRGRQLAPSQLRLKGRCYGLLGEGFRRGRQLAPSQLRLRGRSLCNSKPK